MNSIQTVANIDGGIIVTLLVAIFASTGFWSFLTNWINNKSEKKSIQGKMLLGLSHDKIYSLCKYYIRRGYISADEYDNLLYLYHPYKVYGGNGTAKKLMEEVDKLPMCNDDKGREDDKY